MNTAPDNIPDVSILMATYNRAEILRQTLTAMAAVDRQGITTEVVVIDNNSTDHTKDVVDAFAAVLPMRYLFEPRSGKNKALNHALNTIELGEIVVFCDDDIVPAADWLHAIVHACQRWPDYSVFGSKIHLVWPDGPVPGWAQSPTIHGWAFSRHDNIADVDTPYPPGGHPGGPCFWVRKRVFDDGRRYDESIGPAAGGNFFMGSETSFLFQLARDGFGAIHIPGAVIGHQVQPELLTVESIQKRAKRYGGGFYHLRPLPRRNLLQKHPVLWRLVQRLVLAKWHLYSLSAFFSASADKRLLKKLTAIRWLACNREAFNVAAETQSQQSAASDTAQAVVQFVPYWGGNPYQNQLAEHLAAHDVRMEKGDSLKAAFNRYFLRKQRFTVLHIHWLPAVVKPKIVAFLRVLVFMLRLWLLRLFGVKLVWTVHNFQSHEGSLRALDRRLRRTLARMADALITHGRAAKEQIVSKWNLDPKKVFVVPHGHYLDTYPNTVSRSEARRQLQITDQTFVVLVLGGVRPYKGVPELIRAFKNVHRTNALLLIAGKAVNETFAAQLNEQIAADKTIRWDSGFIADDRIQLYMAACDIAAFPYRQVFSSGAVILAMSFARPCLAPAVPAMRDVLDASGAILYDPNTANGLETALQQALENRDRLEEMGRHNLRQARQWDWDTIARTTAHIYHWCLSGSDKETAPAALPHAQVAKG